MNYAQLKAEATALLEIWGYSNTATAPDYDDLTNRAYKDVCWETEIIRGPEIQFATVAGQRDYFIGGPSSTSKFLVSPGNEAASDTLGATCTQDFKSFLDVMTIDNRHIKPTDENFIRRDNRLWLMTTKGIPTYCWSPRPNVMSLYPTPDAVYNILVYGILGPPTLAGTDIPVFWEPLHHVIPLRAAFLHARKYAKGEAREVLASRDSEYQGLIAEIKQAQMEDSGMDTERVVQWPEADRVYN